MSQTTIQLRQTNPDETENKAQYESPNGDAVCASYVARAVAEKLGEYAALTISEDAEVQAERTGISGSGSGNYAIFETPGDAVTGLYVSHDAWSEVTGEDVETDEEGNVTNAPESLGLSFEPSSEDQFEESESVDEEEAEALVAGGSDDSDDSDEEAEITDEELDLVDAE
jgi:hypothetical protein